MAEMKGVLATVGVAPERIHVEIFDGSESLTPGIPAAATRAAHPPNDDANTGPLVSFARSGVVYGPEPLEKPADGNLLICCSQPTRNVVIDL
jgi:hypothetical protein